MSPTEKQAQLPHHKLIAYQLALELVQLVARTRIGEAQLRAQARKSAAWRFSKEAVRANWKEPRTAIALAAMTGAVR